MKEKYLNSKSKKVLIAMCEILKIQNPKIKKTPRAKLIKILDQFSHQELIDSYNQTHFGIRRKEINEALMKYPSDTGAKFNLARMNELKE
jgi:hypothetical protein